jgi:hypothetical protein
MFRLFDHFKAASYASQAQLTLAFRGVKLHAKDCPRVSELFAKARRSGLTPDECASAICALFAKLDALTPDGEKKRELRTTVINQTVDTWETVLPTLRIKDDDDHRYS